MCTRAPTTLQLGAQLTCPGCLCARLQALFEVANQTAGDGSQYLLDFASSGTDAIEALTNKAFDLVLMDRTLPDTLGEELLPRVRSLCGADTCVVMLSVHREAAIRQDCLNAGAAAYMHKPLHLAQVSHAPRRS